jgi:hypothetical protein
MREKRLETWIKTSVHTSLNDEDCQLIGAEQEYDEDHKNEGPLLLDDQGN